MIKECDSFEIPSKKVRVLSFQKTKVVLNILKGETYNPSKNSIWCFNPIEFKEGVLVHNNRFSKEDFLDGLMFDKFRRKMGITDRLEFNGLFLLELEYNIEDLGNSDCISITEDNICAIYKLTFHKENSFVERYTLSLDVTFKFKEDILFPEDFKCYNIGLLENSKKVRVLSFQGKQVVDMLLNGDNYKPIKKFSRENNDYLKEKEAYGFKDVIWCFNPFGFRKGALNTEGVFNKEDFLDGSLFDRFRCQMSIDKYKIYDNLFLLELEYNIEDLRLGLTHNDCSYANVVPSLKKENICAIYKLVFDWKNNKLLNDKPTLVVVKKFKEDVIFDKDFRCKISI